MTSEVERKRLPVRGIFIKAIESTRFLAYPIVFGVLAGGGLETFSRVGVFLPWLVGSAVLSVIAGWLSWLRLHYWFEDGQFRLEQGLLSRKRTFIPLEKVQAVDITVGIVQRVLGLVQLEIKTGAAGSQAKLSALTREEAERIQARLRQGRGVEQPAAAAAAASSYRLTARQLMLAGATSGRLGVVLGGVAWVFSLTDDLVFEYMATSLSVDFDPSRVLETDPLIVAGLVVVGLIVSWLGAVLWELLTYGGFEAARHGDDIVIRRGVFEQRQVTLPIRRVQAVRYYETLLRQPIGHGTLYIEAVGHQEEKGQATVLHPFLSRSDCQKLIADLLPRFDVEYEYVRPPRRALPRFLIKPSLLVALPVAISAWFWTPAVVGFVTLPLVWFIGYVSWRDVGLSLGEEIAVVRGRSYLRRTTAILLRETTQIAASNASLLQRRRSLATVALTVATGPVGRTFKARDLDQHDAWNSLSWLVTEQPGSDVS